MRPGLYRNVVPVIEISKKGTVGDGVKEAEEGEFGRRQTGFERVTPDLRDMQWSAC